MPMPHSRRCKRRLCPFRASLGILSTKVSDFLVPQIVFREYVVLFVTLPSALYRVETRTPIQIHLLSYRKNTNWSVASADPLVICRNGAQDISTAMNPAISRDQCQLDVDCSFINYVCRAECSSGRGICLHANAAFFIPNGDRNRLTVGNLYIACVG